MRLSIFLVVTLWVAVNASAQDSPTREQLIQEAKSSFYAGDWRWKEKLEALLDPEALYAGPVGTLPARKDAKPSEEFLDAFVAYAELLYEKIPFSSINSSARQRGYLNHIVNAMLRQHPSNTRLAAIVKKLDAYEKDLVPLYAGNTKAAAAFKRAQKLRFESNIKNSSEIIAGYQDAVTSDPQFSEAYMFWGGWHYSRGENIEAEALLRKAVAITPSNSYAWMYLGQTLYALGRQEEAERAGQQSVVIAPYNNLYWNKLAITVRGNPMPVNITAAVGYANIDQKDGFVRFLGMRLTCENKADCVFWRAFVDARKNPMSPLGNLEEDRKAWRSAMAAAQYYFAEYGGSFSTPSLNHLYRIAQAGQLDEAVLVFMYQPGYRRELDKWSAANPNGIAKLMAFGVSAF